MKLNSLIKYNSLKIFSLYGYLFEIYYQICHFRIHQLLKNSPDADPEVVYFAFALFATRDYLISFSIVVLIIIFEILWKKFKLRNNTEKEYPTALVIPFYIGAFLGILPFIMMVLYYIRQTK